MQKNLIKNTPVIILCGGKGTRILEETKKIPKPMIKLDRYPLIYHIIRIYMKFGCKNFILATGYKHKIIHNYFTKNLPKNLKQKTKVTTDNRSTVVNFKNFAIRLYNTGLNTNTGARLLKCKKFLKKKKFFMVTYGDGLANIKINKIFNKLSKTNKVGILTAVNPVEKFGILKIKKNTVINFSEKKQDKNKWINAGFFIFRNSFIKYLDKYTYLEFGVYKGTSVNFFSNYVNKIYGFDSFEGLKEDWVGSIRPKKDFNLNKKLPKLNQNVIPVTGWVQDTLDDFLKENNPKINFVNMDVVTYETSKFVLSKIKPYLVNNSIILFNELYNFSGWDVGEYKAFQEVFNEKEYKFKAFSKYEHQVVIKIQI